VGDSESAAKASGRRVVVGRGGFGVNGRALTLGDAEGFVKLVVDAGSGMVIGAQVVGPGASELISELTLAVEAALRVDDVAMSIHPHPTLGEAVVEAARRAQRRLRRDAVD
jgi:dihydrolipoamide dehydrogenase